MLADQASACSSGLTEKMAWLLLEVALTPVPAICLSLDAFLCSSRAARLLSTRTWPGHRRQEQCQQQQQLEHALGHSGTVTAGAAEQDSSRTGPVRR
jgi:hypothetical protein